MLTDKYIQYYQRSVHIKVDNIDQTTARQIIYSDTKSTGLGCL